MKSIQGDALYDWTYADDAASGLLAIGEKGKDGKVYYVGSDKLRQFKDTISRVRDMIAPGAKISLGAHILQGFYISCIEEIAWRRGFITLEQLHSLGEQMKMTDYGKYILSLRQEDGL